MKWWVLTFVQEQRSKFTTNTADAITALFLENVKDTWGIVKNYVYLLRKSIYTFFAFYPWLNKSTYDKVIFL